MAQKWSNVRVVVTEHDRWSGPRDIEQHEFDTREEADTFVKDHNAKNILTSVTEYYTTARVIG